VYGTLYLTVSLYVANAALLWTAPELLRIPRSERPSEGTYSGDVFSFGIIIYETCYLIQPYGEQLNKLGARGALMLLCAFYIQYTNVDVCKNVTQET